MEQRISFQETRKGLMDSMLKVSSHLRGSDMDAKLKELLAYRVSQINGCAFCLDMHHKDAIHHGDTEQRLHGLAAWKESPYYTEPERAVLQMADQLTLHRDVDDATYDLLTRHFTKEQIGDLALAIGMTGAWNQLNKTFRTTAGNYQPGTY